MDLQTGGSPKDGKGHCSLKESPKRIKIHQVESLHNFVLAMVAGCRN